MINPAILKPIWGFCKKHATKLLAGLAIGSEAAALYLTAKAAPVAKEKLDDLGEDATKTEKFRTAAPVYAKAGAAAFVSFASIVVGCVYGEHEKALLAGACSIAQATAAKYQQELAKSSEGKDRVRKAEQEACEEAMRQNPIETANIYATGKGDQLIFEPLSGRYFTSSWNEVEKAANLLNRRITGQMWQMVNEWYELIGLDAIGLGEKDGWNVDYPLDIGSYAQKTNDGRSCLVITYYNRPVRYK